jgi:TonB-linked SusC/RagA family outer membrane protein
MFLTKKVKINIFPVICLLGLLGLFPAGVWAQNISVSGTVVDSEGPMGGVTVFLKGTMTGTATNVAGEYTIQAPEGATLVFSFVGMTTQEIPVNGRRRIDVTMAEDTRTLDEVVVIGYGTLEKKQITSSITSLTSKDIIAGIGGATVANTMKGKVSGLVMSGSDSPNATNEFQLRGMASVNTSKAPLIVIDGMPGGDIRSVVQEDIQSIDILKDASAGAIYGTRATGGVILITTKKAQEGKMRISYTGETSYKQTFGKPEVLNRQEYRRYFTRAVDYNADVDWWEEALTDSPISNRHLMTLQGGSESAKIYATGMYSNDRGILRGDERTDYGGRINGSFKLIDGWLELNTHIDYRQAFRHLSKPEINTILAMNPTRSPYDPKSETGYNIWTTGSDASNTIGDRALTTDDLLEKWFRPDAELKLNILPVKGLSVHAIVGYENRLAETRKYEPRFTTAELRAGRKGTATFQTENTDLRNSDAYVSYVRSFGNHSINAVGGYSYFEKNSYRFKMINKDFSVDTNIWDFGRGTWLKEGDAEMESNRKITEKLIAYFGRLNYTWQGKYIVMASIRHEGSSKFATNKQFGTFWSLSGAWRISDEQFAKSLPWVNDLKLRAGYGETGNEGFDASYAAVMYGADERWIMPSGNWEPAYGSGKNINPDLGWEEKHEWNIGLDYSLLDNRLFGKIDFYRRNIEGLIYNVTVPQPPNVDTKMYKNIGTLENRGFELEIGGRIVRTTDWNYETSINLSHNTTKVGKIFGDNTYFEEGYLYPEYSHRLEEGSTVGSFFVHRHAGFTPNADGSGKEFLVVGVDGEPVLASQGVPDDKAYVGNYTPTLICGWSHNLSYKRWQLYMTLTSWINYDILNAVEMYNGFAPFVSGQGQANKLRSAFTKNGDIKVTSHAPVSSYFLEDGTYLKIQNVNLNYTLPTKDYLKVVDSIRFYLTVNNLYTFTKYSGHNPEVDITGWEHGIEDQIYPQTRTYTLGIQLNF